MPNFESKQSRDAKTPSVNDCATSGDRSTTVPMELLARFCARL